MASVNTLDKFHVILEPMFRKVVKEELNRAIGNFAQGAVQPRSPDRRIQEGSIVRDLRLHFTCKVDSPVYTGNPLNGERGSVISIALKDAVTHEIVRSEPECSAKLDIVVLLGDFTNDDGNNWAQEEFEAHIVRERVGKRPLLVGETSVTLKNGVGLLGALQFTDNSSWIGCRKFRLGARLSPGCCDGIRIREAKTEAFMVKDHRGELYKKHYPPVSSDLVWRLDSIGKDGAFHKRLNNSNISTVEDFLRLYLLDSQKLKNILGSNMSGKMWEAAVEHAETCTPNGKLYYYDTETCRAHFNNLYRFKGIIMNNLYYDAPSLDNGFIKMLIRRAYADNENIKPYDDRDTSVLGHGQGHPSYVSNSESTHEAFPPSTMQAPMAGGSFYGTDASSKNSNFGHMIQNMETGLNFNTLSQTFAMYSDGHINANATNFSYHCPSTSLANEDEIYTRMGVEGDNASYPPHIFAGPFDTGAYNDCDMPNVASSMNSEFGEESGTTSDRADRAYVGWMKLKAALQWGAFVRKYRAEQRAEIEELEEE